MNELREFDLGGKASKIVSDQKTISPPQDRTAPRTLSKLMELKRTAEGYW